MSLVYSALHTFVGLCNPMAAATRIKQRSARELCCQENRVAWLPSEVSMEPASATTTANFRSLRRTSSWHSLVCVDRRPTFAGRLPHPFFAAQCLNACEAQLIPGHVGRRSSSRGIARLHEAGMPSSTFAASSSPPSTLSATSWEKPFGSWACISSTTAGVPAMNACSSGSAFSP